MIGLAFLAGLFVLAVALRIAAALGALGDDGYDPDPEAQPTAGNDPMNAGGGSCSR